MQKNRSKQKDRINKNQHKTKICKGPSRWEKCRLLPLLEGLIASRKYLTGKFAAETHNSSGGNALSLHTGEAVVILLNVLKALLSGFQNLNFFQALEEEVAGFPLCLVSHSPESMNLVGSTGWTVNVFCGHGTHTDYR